jgi:hypothetical protein
MAGGATLGLRPTVCPIRSALIAARTALAADETLQALLTKREALSCGPATVPPRELSKRALPIKASRLGGATWPADRVGPGVTCAVDDARNPVHGSFPRDGHAQERFSGG